MLTGARRKFRDNNGLCAMVQFSQFHTRDGGDAGLSHAALPAEQQDPHVRILELRAAWSLRRRNQNAHLGADSASVCSKSPL